MNDIACAVLIVVGSGFMLLAGLGVVRMPDVFMRMQAATKAATLGAGCMLLATAIHFGDLTVVSRAMLVIAFVFLTAPVAANTIARAAYSVGTPLWTGTIVDEYREHSSRPAPSAESPDVPASLAPRIDPPANTFSVVPSPPPLSPRGRGAGGEGITLLAPFVLTAGILLLLLLAVGPRVVGRLLATSVATFFFLGRFVILGGFESGPGETHSFFTAEQLVLLVVYMDLMTATLVVFHTELLYRLPLVGPKLRALVQDGEFMLDSQPWMKRATFVGLVTFVLLPLASTGSVGGALFGRLLGMSHLAAFSGVLLGSLLGSGLMYLGAVWIGTHFDRSNPILTGGGIAVLVAVLLLLNYRYRQLKRRRLERKS